MSDPNTNAVANPLSRLPRDVNSLYQQQLAFWYAKLTEYQAQITALLVSPVESYTFAGGQGTQSAKRRDLEQAQRGLEHCEARYLYYWRRLNGYGNVSIVLRRR